MYKYIYIYAFIFCMYVYKKSLCPIIRSPHTSTITKKTLSSTHFLTHPRCAILHLKYHSLVENRARLLFHVSFLRWHGGHLVHYCRVGGFNPSEKYGSSWIISAITTLWNHHLVLAVWNHKELLWNCEAYIAWGWCYHLTWMFHMRLHWSHGKAGEPSTAIGWAIKGKTSRLSGKVYSTKYSLLNLLN